MNILWPLGETALIFILHQLLFIFSRDPDDCNLSTRPETMQAAQLLAAQRRTDGFVVYSAFIMRAPKKV